MEFNFNPASYRYQKIKGNNYNKEFVEKYNSNKESDSREDLKNAVDQFTSIFLHQMFKSMRSTVPESKLIDGGFGEDVFTDMLDQRISELGSKQSSFSGLNQILFQQLDQIGK